MDFEESLTYELSTIAGLDGKVFPLGAKEGVEPPFVIYVSSEGEPYQTLDGYTDLTEIVCEIHCIGGSYREMKELTHNVLIKLRSFYNRRIGDETGVFIKSFSHIEPREEHDLEYNYERSSFDITVRI